MLYRIRYEHSFGRRGFQLIYKNVINLVIHHAIINHLPLYLSHGCNRTKPLEKYFVL